MREATRGCVNQANFPHGPNSSRNAAFSEDGCEGASWWERRVVMANAVRSWVKPEVDPPIHNALPRDCVIWEGQSSRMAQTSAATRRFRKMDARARRYENGAL
jgi:hypothetical protein